MIRSGVIRSLVVLVPAAVLGAGCSTGVASLSFPAPSSVPGLAPSSLETLPAGLAGVAEPPVPGATTTTVPALGPGPATLNGTVLGPTGPVGGATVEADRLVGDSVAAARTTTAADGSWSFRNVLGGRYRVRAWRSPDLDLTTPQVVFVVPGTPQPVDLQMQAFSGPQVSAALNPPAPILDQPVDLVVQVVDPSVGPDGVVSFLPQAGAPVTLVGGDGWQVDGSNPEPTNPAGHALFQLTCTVAGADPLSASLPNSPPTDLKMPACGAPPTPTTVLGENPGSGSTTTTTCPYNPGITDPGNPHATTTTLVFGSC